MSTETLGEPINFEQEPGSGFEQATRVIEDQIERLLPSHEAYAEQTWDLEIGRLEVTRSTHRSPDQPRLRVAWEIGEPGTDAYSKFTLIKRVDGSYAQRIIRGGRTRRVPREGTTQDLALFVGILHLAELKDASDA